MDYYSLYESFYNYSHSANGLGSKIMYYFALIVVFILIIIYVNLVSQEKCDIKIFSLLAVPTLFVLLFFIIVFTIVYDFKNNNSNNTDKTDAKINELNNIAVGIGGDTLDNIVYNVEYLSNHYENRLEYFKFVYGNNIPSERDYINNILNTFYGKAVESNNSNNIDYSVELKEVETSLRKEKQIIKLLYV